MISPAWSLFLIGTKIGLFFQVAPLSVVAKSCPSVCRCDAGFIYCNDRSLTSIPVGIPEDATTLYLQNNQINNVGIPSDLKNLLKVQRIYLYHNSLDEFPTNLPKYVKELHLQENNIRTITYDSLSKFRIWKSYTWMITQSRLLASKREHFETVTICGCFFCPVTTLAQSRGACPGLLRNYAWMTIAYQRSLPHHFMVSQA